VFDIETEDWDRFVVGGILWGDGTYRSYSWRGDEQPRMACDLLSTPGTIWAHNGGLFDAKWLLDWCLRLEVPFQVTPSGPRIVRLKAGACEVLDSFALTKISLADLSQGLKLHKVATGLPCVCKEDCGGYCSIKRRMPDNLWRRLLSYLRRDCESLFAALEKLEEWAAKPEVDLDLTATVGGAAFRSAQRKLDFPDASLTWGQHMFARRSYFGGRTQEFRPLSDRGFEYDVVSMYPSQLAKTAVPWGTPGQLWAAKATRAFDRRAPGCYMANVCVPAMHLPPLPIRRDNRIWYPTGRFAGVWTTVELAYAEGLGVEVDVVQALVWPESRKPFGPWIRRLFALREGAPGGKSGPIGTTVKFLLNSLTGKFGSKPISAAIVSRPDDLRPCQCSGRGLPGFACDGACGAYRPMDEAGQICKALRWHLGPECHVEWSAFLTSAARVEWHREATSVNDGWDLVYCDTDSMFCERPRTRHVGEKLGSWEFKGKYEKFECRAPKTYSYWREGKCKVRAKGIALPRIRKDDPLSSDRHSDAWAMIVNEIALPKPGIIGLAKGAKEGVFFRRETMARTAKVGYGDRILEPGSEVTRARTFAEVLNEVGS
jgi:hypothetical protein